MINSVRKGYLSQRKTYLWLEKRGWQVYTVPRVRFSKNQDIFHLFDHVSHKNGKLRFTQTKSNYCEQQLKDQIKKFKVPKGVIKDIFLWKNYARTPEIIRL